MSKRSRKNDVSFQVSQDTTLSTTYISPCETSADGVDATRKKTSFWAETCFVLPVWGRFGHLRHLSLYKDHTVHNQTETQSISKIEKQLCPNLPARETTTVFWHKNKVAHFIEYQIQRQVKTFNEKRRFFSGLAGQHTPTAHITHPVKHLLMEWIPPEKRRRFGSKRVLFSKSQEGLGASQTQSLRINRYTNTKHFIMEKKSVHICL